MPDDLSQIQINALLRPPMVCLCKRVPESRIRAVVQSGATTFEEVQRQTACSTGCGSCEGTVRGLIERFEGEMRPD